MQSDSDKAVPSLIKVNRTGVSDNEYRVHFDSSLASSSSSSEYSDRELINFIRSKPRPKNMGPAAALLLLQVRALVARFLIRKRRHYIMTTLFDIVFPIAVIALIIHLLINYSGQLDDQARFAALQQGITLTIYTLFIRHFTTSTSQLTLDKSSGLRSLMTIMGLRKISYYIGTIVTMMLLYSLPLSLTLGTAASIYLSTEAFTPTMIFTVLVVFCFQMTALVLALGSMINSPTVSNIVTIVMWSSDYVIHTFMMSLPITNGALQAIVQFLAILLPNEGLRLFTMSLTRPTLEGRIMFSFGTDSDLPKPSTAFVLISMTIWSVGLFIFSWYFDAVCPWKPHEAPKTTFYFIKKRESRLWNPDNPIFPAPVNDPFSERDPRYFENPPRDLALGIFVDRVTKSFNGAPRPAVDEVSFSVYKGQTTLLLGHNGAGKTTLMNSIIGQIRPSEGKVYVNGYSIDTCTEKAGKFLGLCPQDSILDMDLTVEQHLNLFADLKGYPSGEAKRQHINKVLNDVGLSDHRHKVIDELSGGMKRKLSLGMAFVGDSSVLILDEPSSGLDPESRKSVWDLIRRYRAERTVLLSTQHMEEADYLGDRVCIMSKGKIVCCGSSLFLKRVLGSAYKLRVECLDQNAQIRTLMMVRQYFPQASIVDQGESRSPVGESTGLRDVTVELTTGSQPIRDDSIEKQDDMIKLFEDLESNCGAYGIKSFGLKGTTVEDVLLNLSSIVEKEYVVNMEGGGRSPNQMDSLITKINKIPNPQAFERNSDQIRLFTAFMIKHWHSFRRRTLFTLIWQLLLPIWMIYSLCRAIHTMDRHSGMGPQLSQNLQMMPATFVAFMIFHPTEERATKFKLMQLTSRANVYLYWLAQFTSDALKLVVYSLVMCLTLSLYFEDMAMILYGTQSQVVIIVFLATMLFGFAAVTLAYLMSHIFERPASAVAGFISILMSGLFLNIVLLLVKLLTSAAWLQKLTSEIIPMLLSHSLATDTYLSALTSMVNAGIRIRIMCQERPSDPQCTPGSLSFLSWHHGVAQRLIALVLQFLFYSIALGLIEYFNLKPSVWFNFSSYGVPKYPSNSGYEDEDVASEDVRARQPATVSTSSLVSLELTKSYNRSIRAVDGVTFAVNNRECFGLLGINGAGKSTTFGMLTGDVTPDYGSVLSNGCVYGRQELLNNIGYDPQHNPLFDLTPLEALRFMARLRGFKQESELEDAVRASIELVEMQEHAHKLLRNLSGGTKRKLALMMSLIGAAPIILLDEPTAGIDPMTRREIWFLLATLRSRHNCSVIISSHAMEECEAICDRMTIMVHGKLRCLGTFQRLRSKFGRGYVLRVQLGGECMDQDILQRITQELNHGLNTQLEVDDVSVNGIVYKIHDSNIPRSQIFRTMRTISKTKFADYSITMSYILTDSTLEDIFVSFARDQQGSKAHRSILTK